jgi:hypothetical protein
MADDLDRMIEFNIVYHPSPYPHAMRSDLAEIAGVCDGIYVPITESDLLYAPRKVKACVDLAHEANLIAAADCWGLGNLFSSAAVPSLYTVQHPDQNCVTNRGRSIPVTCPGNESFRSFLRGYVGDLITKFGFDGVFWDEPGLKLPSYMGKLDEGEWACCCEACKSAYREKYGADMPDTLTPEVKAFRNDSLLSLLAELCAYTKKGGEHLITSVCVSPQESIEFKEAVARTENLDIYGSNPYWRPDMDVSQRAHIDKHATEAVDVARANGKLVETWVSAGNPLQQHERDPYRAAKLMAAHDIDFISAWAYRDYQSWASAERLNRGDPDLVWKNLSQAYREIREGDLEIHA